MTHEELALDFEAHVEQALVVPNDHRLQGVTVPLGTRGSVLKMAEDAPKPHVYLGGPLQGKSLGMTKSLPLLGGL